MGKGQRGDQYESAMNAYNNLNDLYKKYSDTYTGNVGYQNSLQQAAQGAGTIAQNQAAQTQASARNTAGMTRAQAAAMGANTVNSAYGNNFQNQQQLAYNAGNDALSATNQNAQNQIQGAQTEQNESQNRYDRTWGNISNAANLVGQAGKIGTTQFGGSIAGK